uniref:Uncharacterized protein n=1 Tax=Brassica oleracea var. oleracea TaxID=109376 RepID=A0A0D3E6J1_BRAOL
MTSEDQLSKGNSIILKPEDSNSASWFTKETIQRKALLQLKEEKAIVIYEVTHYHDRDHEEEYDEQEPKWHSEPGGIAGQPETPCPPGEINFLQWTKVFQFVSSDYTKPIELEPLRDLFHGHEMMDTSDLMIRYLSLFRNHEAHIQVFEFERILSSPSYHVLLHQCRRDACLKFMYMWKKSMNLVS